MNELKLLRMEKRLTQKETAKYRFLLSELKKINLVDEEHGILSLDEIMQICKRVFSNYPVDFCCLFGSYAKGKATETSDVDLLIASDVTVLRFYKMTEKLREALHKKIDLLDVKQVVHNEELLREVLKEGVRIYG